MKKRGDHVARLAALLVVWALVGVGCDDKAPAPAPEGAAQAGVEEVEAPEAPAAVETAPKIVYEEGPKPTDDTVIARAGAIEVTMADFADSVRVGRLFAPAGELDEGEPPPEVPPERLALPHLHVTMSQSLLNRKIIAADLAARGITIDDEAIEAYLREDPTLSRWGEDWGEPELEQRLARMGLTSEDLAQVAREQLQRRRLEDELLATITDEELWERYRMEHHTVTLLLAATPNTPTREEIDALMEREPEAVEAYFEEHKGDFAYPPRLVIDLLRPPKGGEGAVDPKTLKAAADRLAAGEAPAKIAADLGLELATDQLLARAENPKAFGGDVGSTGFVIAGPRGPYAWRVVGRREGRTPELSRPLRREVAAELLRKEGLTPSAKAKLEEGAKLLRAWDGKDRSAIEAKLRELGLRVHLIDELPQSPDGYIPEVGLAEELVEQAFELTPKRPVSPKPVFSRQVGYVARLLDREVPKRADFRARKDELKPIYVAEARKTILDRYIQGVVEELGGVHIDVAPLRRRYGVLQKGRP